MIIHYGYEHLNLKQPVVTIGIFDGVHRGHRFLLDTLVGKARETGGDAVVITFDPHPRIVLDNNPAIISFLSTNDEKISLLNQTGIDHLIIIEFTQEFSRTRACDFVNEVLIKKIGTRNLIIGHDHRFGFGGEGNADTIKDCAVKSGIEVVQLSGLIAGNTPISSSLIRKALMSGKPELANDFLGYTYSVKGKVVEGKKLGRDLGFPTANIKPEEIHKLLPSNGVYAVEVKIDRGIHAGMMNIGTNPTVSDENSRSVEVNIFDFDKDIYGKTIEVFVRYRLRDEIKFSSLAELTIQMEEDKKNVMDLLSNQSF
jgi:riboflavin kinase / FMN adenylyltransferase